MKRYTLLLILMLSAVVTIKAQTQNEQWFEQANAAYNVGNYDSAMMLYEQILATDMAQADKGAYLLPKAFRMKQSTCLPRHDSLDIHRQ